MDVESNEHRQHDITGLVTVNGEGWRDHNSKAWYFLNSQNASISLCGRVSESPSSASLFHGEAYPLSQSFGHLRLYVLPPLRILPDNF
jgi:hypothetical protein